MGKKVAVILSGCGVYDGSEIYESVLTLLRLDQHDVDVQCFAPNINQMHVINHLSGEEMPEEQRNVLEEAARLVRGDIQDLSKASTMEFDAVIVPGGFGAAKNLSNFAVSGSNMLLNQDFASFVQKMHLSGKPIGLVCIAPAMSGKLFDAGIKCTIGSDPETIAALEATGAVHQECTVDEICVDLENKLVTTPAYMLAGRISEAAAGINKLVDKVLELTG